tara:strand:- start:563 stop:664 length:102 start_codon:yes stop_codon:yes gene_type:complete
MGYKTKLPDKKLLQSKLHEFLEAEEERQLNHED